MRKMLMLLALVPAVIATTGCSRGRNLFRRGSPCCGTSTIAPARIGRPIAIGRPLRRQLIVPPAIPATTQIVMPTAQSVGCPEYCEPCATPCEPGQGEWFGGYVGDAPIDGGRVNCDPTTTYEGDYGLPTTETSVIDPAPSGDP